MVSLDLDRPAIVSLRPPGDAAGRNVTVFAGTYGAALMVVAALPFPMRDRAIVEAVATDGERAEGRLAAA